MKQAKVQFREYLKSLSKKKIALLVSVLGVFITLLYTLSYCLVLPLVENGIQDEKNMVAPTLMERVAYFFYEPVESMRNHFDSVWSITESGYKFFGGRRPPKERTCLTDKRRDLIFKDKKLIAEVYWGGKQGVKVTKWYDNGQKASLQNFPKNQFHTTICWNKDGSILAKGTYKHTGFYHPSTLSLDIPLLPHKIGEPFEGTFCEYSFPNKEFIITRRKNGKLVEAKYFSGKIFKRDFIDSKLIVKSLDLYHEIDVGSSINAFTDILGEPDADVKDGKNSKYVYNDFFGLSKNLELIVSDMTVIGITANKINTRLTHQKE